MKVVQLSRYVIKTRGLFFGRSFDASELNLVILTRMKEGVYKEPANVSTRRAVFCDDIHFL